MLDKTFDPTAAEPRLYKAWEESGLFAPRAATATATDGAADAYSIVIPPPNVTGSLHIGHALNNTLQDILVRYHRMLKQGRAVAAGHRPRRHRHPDDGRAPAGGRGQPRPPRDGPRELHRARLGVEGRERRHHHEPAQAPRRAPRPTSPANASPWASAAKLQDQMVRAVTKVFVELHKRRPDLSRQAAGQLAPAFGDGDFRPRGRKYRDEGPYVAPAPIRWPMASPISSRSPSTRRARPPSGRRATISSWPRPGRKPCWATPAWPCIPTMRAMPVWSANSSTLPLVGRRIPIVADAYADPAWARARSRSRRPMISTTSRSASGPGRRR